LIVESQPDASDPLAFMSEILIPYLDQYGPIGPGRAETLSGHRALRAALTEHMASRMRAFSLAAGFAGRARKAPAAGDFIRLLEELHTQGGAA
jgi:hypothetical protein